MLFILAMKRKSKFHITWLIFGALLIAAPAFARAADSEQTYGNKLEAFTSDGCSGFPDGIPLLASTLWRHCCVQHDLAYWQGGTAEQRKAADDVLRTCVSKTSIPLLGEMMYLGVRVGGYTGLPTSWRWGYGWMINTGYHKLLPDEQVQLDKLLKDVPSDLSKIDLKYPPAIPWRSTPTGDYCLDEAVARIETELGHRFKIATQSETIESKSEGYVKTLSIQVDGCSGAFDFKYLLLRQDACRRRQGEIVARGRLRLMKYMKPSSCQNHV